MEVSVRELGNSTLQEESFGLGEPRTLALCYTGQEIIYLFIFKKDILQHIHPHPAPPMPEDLS